MILDILSKLKGILTLLDTIRILDTLYTNIEIEAIEAFSVEAFYRE